MRSSSIRRLLRSGLIAWRRQSACAATAATLMHEHRPIHAFSLLAVAGSFVLADALEVKV
jgi:hypothetical protein